MINIKFYIGPAIIILTILAVPVFLVPYYNDFQRLEADLRIKERQIEREKEYSVSLKVAQDRLFGYQTELKKIESAIPQGDLVVPEFYNFIKQEIANSGIILQGISIGKPFVVEVGSNLEKTTFSVTVVGTYSSFKSFLSTLYRNSRIVSVDSISMGSANEDGFFQFGLTLGVYSYGTGS
ncbi:MAG: type 4a pilus biogenesis protein PilO [Candidatus Pacebacteria bacterium]|jgi:Tfp pilus assembly protein PilO|nr:type 4a pilus biogenesis protein PilO [Candidatus Paceibacterota bacterium]MDD3072633.1 type 4a pilus biogenesis protein PilO [Candidatus Paceibacterota bacterium]MDD3729322.1 type 4a pilus biogenesis protein PilO [Candidatus Paceibacterota bacterium]MDD4201677.1 type 4a pilus biogenesis protein PilO [Candidatus Paceibacterota bacterium]MDD4467025.1 type 4a pilus biogenesis protein PilO [Candidatus Paceibacterota bacterium]